MPGRCANSGNDLGEDIAGAERQRDGGREVPGALNQRGNPSDLYDLWYLFGGSGPLAEVDSDQVAELIPMKFKREFVASGWEYARLYGRMLEEEKTWPTLADLIPDPPPLDEALDLVQKALHFLKQVT